MFDQGDKEFKSYRFYAFAYKPRQLHSFIAVVNSSHLSIAFCPETICSHFDENGHRMIIRLRFLPAILQSDYSFYFKIIHHVSDKPTIKSNLNVNNSNILPTECVAARSQ